MHICSVESGTHTPTKISIKPGSLRSPLHVSWMKRTSRVSSKRPGAVLSQWIERLRVETGQGFPEKVTAFRDGMAVHGRYGHPCPACGSPVQRIVYSQNEANYCPTCQTGGKLLADRALSRLLKADWPKSLEDMTQLRTRQMSDSRHTTERPRPA